MYLTFIKIKQENKQITLADYLNNNINTEKYIKRITVKTNNPPKSYNKEIVESIINALININNKYNINDINSYYYDFAIPKKTGGLRHISAPQDELKQDLRLFKEYITIQLKVLEHPKAYAYVSKKNCKAALLEHSKNQSKWFLKLDIKDFFPSCSLDFTIKMLKQVYPFQDIPEETLKEAFQICFKDNCLPQGTPTSPLLTNLLMVPIDYAIEEYCNKHYLVYTRYADDILISSKHSFKWQHVENVIQKIFEEFEAPFKIKKEKTRYGSSAGRNWNLGLMYTKENQISIGTAKKKTFKAMLNNFALDYKNNNFWSKEDTRHLIGLISYYRSIEPDYINGLIKKAEQKHSIIYKKAFKSILKNI